MKLFKYCLTIAALIALASCGGGGGSDSSSSSSSSTTPASTMNLATPAGTTCGTVNNALRQPIATNTDVFGNLAFWVSSVIGSKSWSCLIVNKSDGQPVFDGNQSVRFEVRPGDCTAPNYGSTSDCVNDRSRSEINNADMNSGVHPPSTQGQIITYEYYVYIPAQANFQPPWSKTGSAPLTVLTQINWQCGATVCPSLGSNGYGAFAYLLIDSSGTLFVQTHQDFTWLPNAKVGIDSSPFDKWIKLKYVIKSSSSGDGFFQAYANDKLIINEARATLPNLSAYISLKLGIYNSAISSVSKPWSTQVIYYDAFSTSVQNF